jgi:hypothetical protein
MSDKTTLTVVLELDAVGVLTAAAALDSASAAMRG